MRLTTKGRFAVTAMLDLAMNSDPGKPVTLSAVSARQNISQAYLEQLFVKLRRARLVAGVRGPGGGYLLVRPRQSISVSEIIDAVEDTMDATQCGGEANCREGAPCAAHWLWSELNRTVKRCLSEISLDDVLRHAGNGRSLDVHSRNIPKETAHVR